MSTSVVILKMGTAGRSSTEVKFRVEILNAHPDIPPHSVTFAFPEIHKPNTNFTDFSWALTLASCTVKSESWRLPAFYFILRENSIFH